MQRLLIVYNPRSSRYTDVKREVLEKANHLNGYMVGKYEVEPTDIDSNTKNLTKILKDGDLVLSAGGDATGVISANAILESGKDVTLAVLPFGNFNDLARTLGTKTFEDVINACPSINNLYPLEILVDGKHFRYATCYVTIGMTAEAVQLYNSPKMRAKLKTKFGRKIGSYTNLARWYFKNRHQKQFIPTFKLNGESQHPKTSDYAAINGRFMARVMKGREDYLDPTSFRSETDHLTYFYRLSKLMLRSIFFHIPSAITKKDILDFDQPSTVTLQAEGESAVLKDIKQIEIRKSSKCLKVVTN